MRLGLQLPHSAANPQPEQTLVPCIKSKPYGGRC